jgi:hypothetical protein
VFGLVHHLLLVGSVASLAAAALRAAALASPSAPLRVLAAAPIAVGTAIAEALALSVAGLGTNPVALAGAALATWLATRRLLPPPERSLLTEIAAGLRGASWGWWVAGGALVGSSIAYVVWLWRYPSLGIDALAYHLPQVVAWVQNGRPGTVREFIDVLPVGNYPQTNEVALAWSAGLARSFSPVAPWNMAMLWLLGGSVWVGGRSLGAPRAAAATASAALCLNPMVVRELGTAGTDLPALAWLACSAALAAGSRERPALTAPALLAAALSVGTKTTTAALAAIAVGAALWHARAQLRSLLPVLLAAAGAALVVGGTWYVRNVISHGSPLWPLVATPWGDPLPHFVTQVNHSLLERPHRTLSGHLGGYEKDIAGGLLLLAGGIAAPFFARSRTVLSAAGATLLATLLWASAPATGASDIPELQRLPLTTDRYLLPAIGAGTVALLLASSRRPGQGRTGRSIAMALLSGAAVWSVARSLRLGFPERPSLATVIGGAALGAGAALALLVARRLEAPPPARRLALPATALTVAALGAVGGTLAASGYLRRHARIQLPLTHAYAPYLAAQPGFADGSGPVFMAPTVSAILAGDRLGHDVQLIPADEPCPGVLARARRGWTVVADRHDSYLRGFTAAGCLRQRRPTFTEGATTVYRPP